MSIYTTLPLQFCAVHTYPLASRKSKVSGKDFAGVSAPNFSLCNFLDSLPNLLAAKDLRELLTALHRAHAKNKPILWGIGGHVIKVGLAPVLIDLIKRGFVSGIAMNGAALIHDFEIAIAGNTSEDVDGALGKGKFGMATETGENLNEIAAYAAETGLGYGEAAGKFLTSGGAKTRFADFSVLVSAYCQRVPVTVHLAIGTDIAHMHPAADGAALGAATFTDFRLFCALVKSMHPGGVYMNWGSAVLLPEIFLKAISVVRNLGVPLRPITTANFDFIQHYRPMQNVVKRPTLPEDHAHTAQSHTPDSPKLQSPSLDSKGFAFTGHHELLMPLVAAALAADWPNRARKKKK